MKHSAEGVSIIICCYNSAKRLPETIRHLALQEVPASIPWEVIVVNNASKDNTSEVASTTWNHYQGNARFYVVNQPLAGLSFAREKGLEKAQYEYLLFCDDDNWLNKDYVRLAYEIIEANPEIGALGGLGVPECEITPPEWVHDYMGLYAVGPIQEKSGEVTPGGVVFGAGSVYRKNALEGLKKYGFRSLLKDREGEKLSSGGDYELCHALTLAGYKIWYDDRLVFKHFIPKERITWDYIIKHINGYTEAEPILFAYRLSIDTIYRKRTKLKNSWQWLLLMRVAILIKNIPLALFLIAKNDRKHAWGTIHRSYKYVEQFFLFRKKHQQLMTSIGKSYWVKK